MGSSGVQSKIRKIRLHWVAKISYLPCHVRQGRKESSRSVEERTQKQCPLVVSVNSPNTEKFPNQPSTQATDKNRTMVNRTVKNPHAPDIPISPPRQSAEEFRVVHNASLFSSFLFSPVFIWPFINKILLSPYTPSLLLHFFIIIMHSMM